MEQAQTVTVEIPFTIRKRGGRKQMYQINEALAAFTLSAS